MAHTRESPYRARHSAVSAVMEKQIGAVWLGTAKSASGKGPKLSPLNINEITQEVGEVTF